MFVERGKTNSEDGNCHKKDKEILKTSVLNF